MKSLPEIAEYYTRLRIAGMSNEEIETFKKTVSLSAIMSNIDVIKLTEDSVTMYEKIQLTLSDRIESDMIKNELKSRGIIE